MECPFCDEKALRAERGFVTESDLWIAFKPMAPPGHVPPASPLHTLLVPRLHVTRLWLLPLLEAQALPGFVAQTLTALVGESGGSTVDHNIGINQGAAAGQTVEHLHLHLIPRQVGDVAEPVGGIITPLAERLWASPSLSEMEGK